MKGIAFLLIGLVSVANADEQFYGVPLRVMGSMQSKGNLTTYTITLQNITNAPIADLQIHRAGLWIHSREYRPSWRFALIPAQGKKVITVTVRGTVSGLVDHCLIGIEGSMRQGRSRTTIGLRQPRQDKTGQAD